MRSLGGTLRSLLFCCALFAAAVTVFGCGHIQKDRMEDTVVGLEEWPPKGYSYNTISAALSTGKIHELVVKFGIPMKDATVDVSVRQESSGEIGNVQEKWSGDRLSLHLYGPFPFCSSYIVTIKAGAMDSMGDLLDADMELKAGTGQNPLDVDRSALCTADTVLSPLFTDALDGALITGEMIDGSSSSEVLYKAEIDSEKVFYVDDSEIYEFTDRMIRVPGLSSAGNAGIAKLSWDETISLSGKLVSTHYWIDVWDSYDPVDEALAASIKRDINGGYLEELRGPFDAGDLNGDGARELMVSGEMAYAEGDLLQNVYILPGPLAHGDGLLLTDVAGRGKIMGSYGEGLRPFVAVGDLDGDRMDDLAAIHYQLLSPENRYKWEVWVAHGNKDISQILGGSQINKIAGAIGREMFDIDAGDVNGDGISDLLVVDGERKIVRGNMIYIKPHVSVFFGGNSFDGLDIEKPDSQLAFGSKQDTQVSLRVLGDINGDGTDDIGVHLIELGLNDRVLSSHIYLFMGKKQWFEGYYMDSASIVNTNAKIDVKAAGYDEVFWKAGSWDPMTGDLDNDGFYDFMIVGRDGSDTVVHWFFGNEIFSSIGRQMTLDDADIVWTFGL